MAVLDTPVETDLNLSILNGRLAVDAELRTFESGAQLIRFLVTVRTTVPRSRVDVIPATLWDPDPELVDNPPRKGDWVQVLGSLQRRYWDSSDGRRSRIELVAEQVIR